MLESCHIGKHSSCNGLIMKVESANEMQPIRHLDQPGVTSVAKTEPAKVDELAHLFMQEVSANNRTLNQRSLASPVPPAGQLAQLYDQLGHPAQTSLQAISLRIRTLLLQRPSVDKLLELTGGDPARAFVVLKHVADQADQADLPELPDSPDTQVSSAKTAQANAAVRASEAALARDAITKLQARYKGEIQAGLNIAMALQAGGVDPQERQALRTLYYASVVKRQSLAMMMQALLGAYGREKFSAGLKVMRKALADDIAANVSSIPTPQLRTLMLGLQSCGQLNGALANCEALIERLSIEEDAVDLLQRMLGYASSGIAAAEVTRLSEDMGGGTSQRPLVTLNALYPLIQQLPLALWPDARVRQEALHFFLVVMDELARTESGPAGVAGGLRNLA